MSLRVEGLWKAFAGRDILAGVDLDIPDASSVFLLGPSGSGKTTMLRCVAGLDAPDRGRILHDGADITATPVHERGVGMLFQEPALFPHLTVWQNVAFGLRYHGVPKDERRARADDWLDRVGLADRAEASVDDLSGGERQRVALARTLAPDPKAVLLDEPFSALDRDLRERLGTQVRDLLHDAVAPALWVTHDEPEAQRLGDVVWRLQDGRAVPA